MQYTISQEPGIVHYLSEEPEETVKRAGARQIPFTQQFLEFYRNQQAYQLTQSNVNDPIYGKIDIYTLKEHFQTLYSQKKGQKFPTKIAVKSLSLSQQEANELTQKIENHNREFFALDVQFVKILGYENSNQFKIYYEYKQKTLRQEIEERRVLNNPFQEKLLWKILYNLVKAAGLAHEVGFYFGQINVSSVFYDQFQVKAIPYGFLPDVQGRYGQQSMNVKDESYQIGKCVLMAGLMLTENEFQESKLEDYLRDFGQIYSGTEPERVLHFTVQRLLLNRDANQRLSPQQVFEIFRPVERHIYFLDTFAAKRELVPQFEQRFPDFRSFYMQYVSDQHLTHKHNIPSNIQVLTSNIIRSTSPVRISQTRKY